MDALADGEKPENWLSFERFRCKTGLEHYLNVGMKENLNRKGRKQVGTQRFNMVMTDEDMAYLHQLKKELGCRSIAHTIRVVLNVVRAFGSLVKRTEHK